MDGKEEVLAKDSLAMTWSYCLTGCTIPIPKTRRFGYISLDGNKKEVASGIAFPNGLTCSTDQTLLTSRTRKDSSPTLSRFRKMEACSTTRVRLSALRRRQFEKRCRWDEDGQPRQSLCCYKLGVQVLDQPGRVNLIISKPQPAFLSNIAFAGAKT